MRHALVAVAILSSVSLSAQIPAFQRGDTVRVLPGELPGGTPTLSLRVVGLPADTLHVVDSRLYVNDSPVTGFSTEFLARVAGRLEGTAERVPTGHYYVMGEQRRDGNISEYWGVHPEARLARAQ